MDDRLTDIIGALIEVHRHVGPGAVESTYEHCVCAELEIRRIPFARQVVLPVVYKGIRTPGHYRMDIVVRDEIILELKAVEQLLQVHEAQLISYLRLSGMPVGLLVNFKVATLKNGGLRRLTREPPSQRPV